MGFTISPKELKASLAKGDKLVLVDVREEWEYSLAKLDGSILIPLGTLPQSLAQLNRDSEIIAICFAVSWYPTGFTNQGRNAISFPVVP